MKFASERDRVDSRPLQLFCERLQFAVRICQRLIAVLRHNDLSASHSDFKSLEPRRDRSNGLVSVVQTSQCVWMVSLVQPRRIQQDVESPQRSLRFIRLRRRQLQHATRCRLQGAARCSGATAPIAFRFGNSRNDRDGIAIVTATLRPNLRNAIGQVALSESDQLNPNLVMPAKYSNERMSSQTTEQPADPPKIRATLL